MDTVVDVHCQNHGLHRCTICEPPPWLFPGPVDEQEVSEA